jgi:hypothetical protein
MATHHPRHHTRSRLARRLSSVATIAISSAAAAQPHTAPVDHATQRHDYRNGCKAYTDCHPPVVQYPIAVPTLAPEIAAPWTFATYRASRDPAIDAVAKALGR